MRRAPPPAERDHYDRRRVTFLGNDTYRNGLPALNTAAGDAQAVAQTLKNVYGFKVTLLTNATRNQIIGALARLRERLTWDDNLLIHYAGHGSFDQAGDQYFPDMPDHPGNGSDLLASSSAFSEGITVHPAFASLYSTVRAEQTEGHN